MRQMINKTLKIKLFAVACGASLAALMAAPKVDALSNGDDGSIKKVKVGICIGFEGICGTTVTGNFIYGKFVEIDAPIVIEEPEKKPEDLPTK